MPPQISAFSFGDEPSNTGDMAGVQCMVSKGDLPLNIHWTLNNITLNSGDYDISISRLNQRTSVLNIDSLRGEHRGVYSCIANNKAGFIEYNAELNVNGSKALLYLCLRLSVSYSFNSLVILCPFQQWLQ